MIKKFRDFVAEDKKEYKEYDPPLTPYRKWLITKGGGFYKNGVYAWPTPDGKWQTQRKKGTNIVNKFHKDKNVVLSFIDNLKEEAPTNNVGSGNIDGVGVGAKGEPGVSKKRQKSWQKQNQEGQGILRRQIRHLAPPLEEGRFAGHKTFKVPTSTIVNTKLAKRKNAHWSKFLPENNVGLAIREWANANPQLPVILEDDMGNIVFVRYGKE